MRTSTETLGDILVTIEKALFDAEPRCDILAAIAEHREIRQVFVPLVERVALLPSQGFEDRKRRVIRTVCEIPARTE